MRKLPARFAGVGWSKGVVAVWLGAWGLSWIVAFPTLLMVLPLVRKATAALVEVA